MYMYIYIYKECAAMSNMEQKVIKIFFFLITPVTYLVDIC